MPDIKQMIKTMTGWRETDDGTHVMLAKNDYNDIVSGYNRMQKNFKNLENEIQQQEKRITTTAEAEKKQLIEKANNNINHLLAQLEEARAEAEYQRGLNVNLLRVNRERSNSDRKLQPKKKHPGYCFLASKEKELKYQEKKKTHTRTVWETSIQSPYTLGITAEQARTQIREELLPEGDFMLKDLGIDDYNPLGFQTLFTSQNYNINSNCVCETRLIANGKTDYWEFVIVHTLPLRQFRFDMLN